MMIFRDWSI